MSPFSTPSDTHSNLSHIVQREFREHHADSTNRHLCQGRDRREYLHRSDLHSGGDSCLYPLFREFGDVFAWSYEEMPDIDPSIVVHEIPTYPGAKPVRQRLHPVHPRKVAAIKAEVEKLLKAGFIYPIPLTEWVSNIVPVNKKQGTIRVCVDYRDINRACLKDNYPTPFIDQLIDECAGICLDPLKVKAIVNLPPPATLRQLQSLQGKDHFLRRFISNYAEVAKGFTQLLKRDTPFGWDAIAEELFAPLKTLLVSAPLLRPPNYHRDYTLYLAAADTTIGMVLVQDDDHGIEHVIYYLSHNLLDTETQYAYVEKLALATVCAVQRFRHYILLRTTTVISDCNPMTYILSRQLLGGKYSKWIVILQEFNLEFTTAKSKKSLVFVELLCSLPSAATSSQIEELIPDETLFLISTLDPRYGDIIVYFQTSSFHPETSKDARRWIRHQAQPYHIVGDTLYRLGVDSILRRCLTFEEAERVLNDCHSGACGGHMPGYATAQKILRVGYFWPSIFKDCILAVRSCHECQIYQRKMRAPATPLHPIVTIGPFAKWGIDYVTCNPRLAGGHGYIIVAIDYFTKWAEAMPTLSEDGHTVAQFLFNHVISRFGVPQAIATDHGKHFRNHMMVKLTTQLGLRHDSSSPYYPQANGQVEAMNKVLVTMLQRIVGMHKSN
eukprot:PITA_11702